MAKLDKEKKTLAVSKIEGGRLGNASKIKVPETVEAGDGTRLHVSSIYEITAVRTNYAHGRPYLLLTLKSDSDLYIALPLDPLAGVLLPPVVCSFRTCTDPDYFDGEWYAYFSFDEKKIDVFRRGRHVHTIDLEYEVGEDVEICKRFWAWGRIYAFTCDSRTAVIIDVKSGTVEAVKTLYTSVIGFPTPLEDGIWLDLPFEYGVGSARRGILVHADRELAARGVGLPDTFLSYPQSTNFGFRFAQARGLTYILGISYQGEDSYAAAKAYSGGGTFGPFFGEKSKLGS